MGNPKRAILAGIEVSVEDAEAPAELQFQARALADLERWAAEMRLDLGDAETRELGRLPLHRHDRLRRRCGSGLLHGPGGAGGEQERGGREDKTAHPRTMPNRAPPRNVARPFRGG